MATIDLRHLDTNQVGNSGVDNGGDITWGEILTAFGPYRSLDRVLRELYDDGLIEFTFTDGTVAQDTGRNPYRDLSLKSYSPAQREQTVKSIAVEGGNGKDTIYGTDLAETIKAGNGEDRVIGGGGADVQTGGRGKDTFIYQKATDSADEAGRYDLITDFSAKEGDKIDLSGLGKISWGGEAALGGGAPSAWYSTAGSTASLFIDVDGNGAADMRIDLKGVTKIAHTDLIGVAKPASTPPAPPASPTLAAKADTASISEDARLPLISGNVLANDASGLKVASVDGQKLLPNINAAAIKGAHGALAIGASGKWVYTLRNADPVVQSLGVDETLTETFTYVATGKGGATASSTLTVTIKGTNDGPVAVKDIAEADAAASVDISVLQNDTDKDASDTLVVTSARVTKGQGTASVNPDGTVKYDPAGAYDGLKSGESAQAVITYQISDGHGGKATSTATVTIKGKDEAPPEPEAPVAKNDEGSTGEDAATTLSVLDNDTGSGLSVISAEVPDGAVVVNPDNTLTFTPGAAFNSLAEGASSQVEITYVIKDQAGATASATAVVTVTGVNDAPTAVGEQATTAKDRPVTFNVLENDSDPDTGAVLTVAEATVEGGGTVTAGSDGTLTYDPGTAFKHLRAGESEEVIITYTVKDQHGASSTVENTVTITGSNAGPTAVADAFTTDEDSSFVMGLLANDTDPDGDSLKVTSAEVSGGGSVSISNDGDVTFDPGTDFDNLSKDQSKQASVTYTIEDGNGASSTATSTVKVTGVNDAPVAVAESASIVAGEAVTLDVLANDTDPDQDSTLNVVAAELDGGGTLVIGEGGTLTYDSGHAFSALRDGATAEAKITYTIEDEHGARSSATNSITVTGGNDGPTAVAETVETDEDTPVTISVLANDIDPDGDELDVREATSPDGEVVVNDDNTVTFTPNSDFGGLGEGESKEASITYTVQDPGKKTSTVVSKVMVAGRNDVPIAGDDAASTDEASAVMLKVLQNDSDPENDTLTIARAELAEGSTGVVSIKDGEIIYDPNGTHDALNAGETAVANIDYTIEDGKGGSTVGRAVVTVTGINNNTAPVAATDAGHVREDYFVNEFAGTVLSNDSDPDGHELTVTGYHVDGGSGETAPGEIAAGTYGTLILQNDGGYVYQLDNTNTNTVVNSLKEGDQVTDTFTYTVSDMHGASASSQIVITITGSTNAPNARDPNDFEDSENIAANIEGTAKADLLYGIFGDDRTTDGNPTGLAINGRGGNDIIYARSGNDTAAGANGDDTIYGGSGNDRLNGGDGDDHLYGGAGADTLVGGAGADWIIGGFGIDRLTGDGPDIEAASDRFVFSDYRDRGDTITDFVSGTDVLDFTGIDANTATSAHDAFLAPIVSDREPDSWAQGQLYFNKTNGALSADITGDGSPDFWIRLENVTSLNSGDFLL